MRGLAFVLLCGSRLASHGDVLCSGELRLVEQADKLVELTKSTFPESASNNQFARYFYYTGIIKAIQLEYSEALNYLQEALRKAPQTGVVGFRITVSKWIVIVQLLKGEIPPRSMFTQKPAQLRTALVRRSLPAQPAGPWL